MKLWLLAGALGLVAFIGCNGASQARAPAAKSEAAPVKPGRKAAARKPKPKSAPKPGVTVGAAPAPAPATQASVAKPDEAVPAGMKLVPGGTFRMGSDDEGEQDEHPAHDVTLKAYWLDVYEVTNGEYLECVNAKRCSPYRDGVAKSMNYGNERAFRGAKQPVVGVSWNDAKSYCEWKGKRLPTEAEWERAARGDDGRKYPWGNDTPDPKKHGCFQGCQGGTTAVVGSFPADAGPYGHHDLAGSVWEWLADHYDPYAYRRSTAAEGVPGSCEEILAAQDELRAKKQQGFTGTNPIPTECERVLRGGAFNYHAKGLRSSNRVHHPGGWRILVAGFRCAKDAP